MKIPQTLTVGDTSSWTDDPLSIDGVRYASDLYTLTYELRGAAKATFVAVANGGGWKTTLSVGQAAALVAGSYVWAAYLSATNFRLTAGTGELVVAPDLAGVTASTYDGRSVAEKALADAESALASFKASGGKIKRYAIGQRQMEFASIGELLQVIGYWKAKVFNEQAAKDIANGLGNPRNLMVRFK